MTEMILQDFIKPSVLLLCVVTVFFAFDLQVKELSEQVEYLKEDNQSKSEEISFLEKKLRESNEEKVTSYQSNSSTALGDIGDQ